MDVAEDGWVDTDDRRAREALPHAAARGHTEEHDLARPRLAAPTDGGMASASVSAADDPTLVPDLPPLDPTPAVPVSASPDDDRTLISHSPPDRSYVDGVDEPIPSLVARSARARRAWRGHAITRLHRGRRQAAHGARRVAAGVRAGQEHAARGWGALVDRFNRLELSENAILLGFAVAIGLAAAMGVVAFYRCIDLAFTVFYRWTGDVLGRDVLALYRPLITAAGLVTAWTLVRSLRGRQGGENVAAVQLAVARRGGDIPARPAIFRTLAAAVTLGCGGSAGSEGPVAVLGSAVGSFLGRAFRFDAERVNVLVGAGAAAGISASFNAPLAGAFFALEEVLGSLGVAAFPPVVVAAVLASMVSRAFLGNHPAFPIPKQYGFTMAREVVLFYPLLGIVAGLVSVLYVRSFFGAEAAFARLKVPAWAKPVIGGVIVGLMVWVSGGMLVGYGHLAVRVQLFGRMAWTALALLALGKIVATSITMGSGGVGGVFTPSLYIGAVTGGAFGVAASHLFPGLAISPESYALVGMGAVVGAATNAPITAILIVFEMTNDYGIVIPLMLATVVATVVARHVEPDSLYSGWLRRRGEHLEHGTDRDALAGLSVDAVYDRAAPYIRDDATVDHLLEHLASADRTEYPVVDGEGALLGMVTVAELARAAREAPALGGVLLAADLAGPTECVVPADTLLEAVRKMGVRGVGSLPVVDAAGLYLGTVGRAEILAAYQRAVAAPAAAPMA
jgi:CIC family chloride channel protein